MKKIIIFGAGGLGREVADIIKRINDVEQAYEIVGFADADKSLYGREINGITVLGDDDKALALAEKDGTCGIIAASSPEIKKKILEKAAGKIKWENIIAPTACVSPYASLGSGNVIQAFSYVSANVKMGNHCIVNISSVIGHDAVIDDFAAIMPCCGVMGGAHIGEGAFLGVGAKVIPGKTVGPGSIVGAGAVIVNDYRGGSYSCRDSGEAFEELPLIIFGTSGSAKDVYHWIKDINVVGREAFSVIGFIERDRENVGKTIFDGQTVVGCDGDVGEIIGAYKKIGLVLPFGFPAVRERVAKSIRECENVVFPNIIHPSVKYNAGAGRLGQGNLIGPGVIIPSTFSIGDFNLINTNAVLEHDIVLGDFNSVNPSASIAGNVIVQDRCIIGINAAVIQGISIASDVVIGAGAAVVSDIKEKGTYVGIPARLKRKRETGNE